MPNPETGFDQDFPNTPLWTFDALGNLNLAGQLTVGAQAALNHRSLLPGVPVGGAPGAAVAPSGDPSGATDTAAIQAALNANAGSTVALGPGKYWTDAPLTIPPYTALAGPANTTQVSQTDGGAVIAPAPGFTPVTVTDSGTVTLSGVILLLGQGFGGYATVSEEQKITGIMIDGTAGPASVHGILSYDKVQRVQLDRTLVSTVTGDGIRQLLDHAGNQPDAWTAFKVFSRFAGGIGFNVRSADSTWLACVQSNSTGIGWFINTTSNSKYIGCRSEHAGSLGFGYVCVNSANSSGGVVFAACSTDQSQQYGFQAGGTINSVASISSATPIVLSGCNFRRDGANAGSGGGNYAGLFVDGYGGQVTIDGLNIFPGVNDDGTGDNAPQIGMTIASSSKVNIAASYVQGATTAISDDGSNTISSDGVVPATGTTASPVLANPQLKVGNVGFANTQAADLGYLGWAWDNTENGGTGVALGATGTAGAGVLNLIKIPVRGQTLSTTGLRLHLTTLGSSLTSGENFAFLYSQAGTFLAATADQTTAWNTGGTTGGIDASWASGPFAISGDFVWVALVYNGTTGPSFLRGQNVAAANGGAGLVNGKLSAALSRYGSILTGVTSNTPGNFTPSSISQKPASIWAAIF